MRAGVELRELDARQFLAKLAACTGIYAAAMNPPGYQLPGRRTIMERHASYRAFRAVVAVQLPGGEPPASGGQPAAFAGEPPAWEPLASAWEPPASAWEPPASGGGPLVGFAYGFHGETGQWWHDLVSQAVASRCGLRAARDWLADSFEIAEVHVLPANQGRGTGLAMMRRLAAGRPEHTAVLSTMDADTPARRLYRGLGFTDLIQGFAFAGTEAPYAIMGAPLPLRDTPARSARPESPSR